MKHTGKPSWLIKAENEMVELEALEVSLIDMIEADGDKGTIEHIYEHDLYPEYKTVERKARQAERTFGKLYSAWENYKGICIHNDRVPEYLETLKNSTERVPEWAQ